MLQSWLSADDGGLSGDVLCCMEITGVSVYCILTGLKFHQPPVGRQVFSPLSVTGTVKVKHTCSVQMYTNDKPHTQTHAE